MYLSQVVSDDDVGAVFDRFDSLFMAMGTPHIALFRDDLVEGDGRHVIWIRDPAFTSAVRTAFAWPDMDEVPKQKWMRLIGNESDLADFQKEHGGA
ncbi:MAG: hypothetical protein ABUS48_04620 [Pseudomonadota bacterium]